MKSKNKLNKQGKHYKSTSVFLMIVIILLGIFVIDYMEENGILFGNGYGNDYVSVWDTSSFGDSENTQVTLPLLNDSYDTSYNFFVDWGDGTNSTITHWNSSETTHNYTEEGVYEIFINGTIKGWSFEKTNLNDDRDKLLQINNWGSFNPGNDTESFRNTDSLVAIKSETGINLTGVTDISSMFEQSEIYVMDRKGLEKWNTSKIKNMSRLFRETPNFNSNINSWDISSVTDMSQIFREASSFNQPLDNWNTSSVINMSRMFNDAQSFNQNISMWDTSNVEDMDYQFLLAGSMSYDLSSWCVEKIPEYPTQWRYLALNMDANDEPNWNATC